jgi:pantoate--beta-alanine ligase
MKTIRTVAELRAALAVPRRSGERIGLVPTMGAFHDGHLALMRQARRESDVVVVSLFVNPTQFNETKDLNAYPRDEARDAELALSAGVDYLFAPSAEEVYPPGFATKIHVSGVTELLEGASRGPAHFDGVTTVVTKLLNMVAPDTAYFGQKDAQQALVIRRLVTDLDIPVQIEIAPTVREADGLAMSSRNVRLSPEERDRATALHRALVFAAGQLASGETGLAEKKRLGEPIVMVTAYDYPSARAPRRPGCRPGAGRRLGRDDRARLPVDRPVSTDELLMLARAVRRGLRTPFLVGDLPFGSYEESERAGDRHRDAVRQGGRLRRRQARARQSHLGRAHGAIVEAGIPVMGHVGLTPQTATRSAATARRVARRRGDRIAREALALQEAGCFSIVFEAIPAAVAEELMPKLEIPVIGIGAGPAPTARCWCSTTCSGSVRAAARSSCSATPTSRTRWSPASPSTRPTFASAATPVPEHTYSIDEESSWRSFRSELAALLAPNDKYDGLMGGSRISGLRAARPGLLRAVRGGRAEHPARGRPARRAAERLPGQQAPGAGDPRLRAGGRPDHARHHRPAQPHVRHADRPRGHPRARLGARRHRRLHRGGGRLPRAVQDRGADGPGDQARARAQGRQADREAIPRLRGFRDISHYTVEINRLENEGDRITREAIASLFDGGIDPMVVIRWKDLFERSRRRSTRPSTWPHPRGRRHQEHREA